jgi:hypothetical protein
MRHVDHHHLSSGGSIRNARQKRNARSFADGRDRVQTVATCGARLLNMSRDGASTAKTCRDSRAHVTCIGARRHGSTARSRDAPVRGLTTDRPAAPPPVKNRPGCDRSVVPVGLGRGAARSGGPVRTLRCPYRHVAGPLPSGPTGYPDPITTAPVARVGGDPALYSRARSRRTGPEYAGRRAG